MRSFLKESEELFYFNKDVEAFGYAFGCSLLEEFVAANDFLRDAKCRKFN